MDLEWIYAPIKQDLEKVEESLETIITSDVYPVFEIYNHVLASGGKRIRPALVLLSAKSLDYTSSKVIDIACAVELIHMASLIHDDIIDSAHLRRGTPAAHVVWGTETTVTVGDYLFSQAMEILAECENHEVIKTFSKAVKHMAEGELLEIANRRNIELTEERYINIISDKTASLISASCEIMAKLASASNSYDRSLSRYGLNFGISYQIMDDVLDLISTKNQLGKPIGNSIKEGNLSLPIIHILKNGNGEFRKQLLSALLNEGTNDIELRELTGLISSSGALSYTQDISGGYAENAKRELAILKDSSAKQCLLSFADFIVNGYWVAGNPQKEDPAASFSRAEL